MATIVVPFRGSSAKRRLGPAGPALASAMLEDVLAACEPVGRTQLATKGGGQGAAVAAALADVGEEPVLVVNADLPCVRPRDLLALLGAIPPGGVALVRATDGTTNALGLASPRLFEPLYGPSSADRFLRLGAEAVEAAIPNLADDVDTLEDLERLQGRLGGHARAALALLREPAR